MNTINEHHVFSHKLGIIWTNLWITCGKLFKVKYKNYGDWLNGRALGSGSRDSGFDSRVPDQIDFPDQLRLILVSHHAKL